MSNQGTGCVFAYSSRNRCGHCPSAWCEIAVLFVRVASWHRHREISGRDVLEEKKSQLDQKVDRLPLRSCSQFVMNKLPQREAVFLQEF